MVQQVKYVWIELDESRIKVVCLLRWMVQGKKWHKYTASGQGISEMKTEVGEQIPHWHQKWRHKIISDKEIYHTWLREVVASSTKLNASVVVRVDSPLYTSTVLYIHRSASVTYIRCYSVQLSYVRRVSVRCDVSHSTRKNRSVCCQPTSVAGMLRYTNTTINDRMPRKITIFATVCKWVKAQVFILCRNFCLPFAYSQCRILRHLVQ